MNLNSVVMAGAGTMGASLAQVYAQAGYDVTVYNRSQSGIDRAQHLVAVNQETLVAEGILTPEASREAQALVEKLQRFITAHYYDCTKEILSGLGQMYAADERFRENIDRAGGPGTAEFASRAIDIYCR